jgi:hypothetical protein
MRTADYLTRSQSCAARCARVYCTLPRTLFFSSIYSVLQNGCPCRKKSKVSKVSRGVREARAEAREGDQTDEVILVASPKMSTAPEAPCAMRIACSLPPPYTRASRVFIIRRARRRAVSDRARRRRRRHSRVACPTRPPSMRASRSFILVILRVLATLRRCSVRSCAASARCGHAHRVGGTRIG